MLYVFRVLLTGIHLMRTGHVEANLVSLNQEFQLPYIAELVERKTTGPEGGLLADAETGYLEAEYLRLLAELDAARDASTLPEVPTSRPALNALLIRVRGSYAI